MHDQFEVMKRQKVLADFGDFALHSDDLDAVLTEACRLVGEALGTGRAKVLEIQPDGTELLVRAGVGWAPEIVGQTQLSMSERSSESFSIQAGKPVITQDIREENRFEVPAFMKAAGVIALANVPIFVPGQRAYGLLQVDAVEPRAFGQDDIAFLRTYATILGPVIDRLHLVEERRVTQDQLAADYAAMETLQNISTALVSTHELRVLYERIVEGAVTLMHADAASIQVLDAETHRLELRAWRGFDPWSATFWAWVKADTGSSCGRALETGERIIVPDMDWFDGEPEDVEAYRRSGLLSVQSTPLRAHNGRVVGMLSTHWRKRNALREHDFRFFDVLSRLAADLIERTQASDRLRESEARQRALIEGVPQLVWRAVDSGTWTWVSPQWLAYTGQTEADSLGQGWLDVLHPDDRAGVIARWGEAEHTGAFAFEYRLRHLAEDRYRWFQSRATPVRDEDDRVIEWLGTSTDVDDLRAMQDRQQVLVAELQHRTRNLLGVVHSIAGQTLRTSVTLEGFKTAFNDRLGALSRVQGLLSHSESEPVTLDAVLHAELDALGAALMPERVVMRGPTVRLRKHTVETFALALHELATNARKYGALANDRGRLHVTWRTYADEAGWRLTLDWHEIDLDRKSEVQSPVTQPGGYGRELIERALPYALQARTTYELGETDLRCTIDLPLSERAASEER